MNPSDDQFLPAKQLKALHPHFDRLAFREAVLQQIRKDFLTFNHPLEAIEQPTLRQLETIVLNAVQTLTVKSPSTLRALLYQIDIPESAMAILPSQENEYLPQLSHWIVLREAYKVYLRQTFR